MRLGTALAVMVLAFATGTRAEVADRSAMGFESRHEVAIAAPPARVYAALMQVGHWWSSEHSWSGDAKNLSLDMDRRCFCEAMPGGGFVQHLAIVYADGKTLRLAGALGPLQTTGAYGHLGFATSAAGQGTKLVVTYDVGGYAKGGLAETWADPVDAVIGEQVGRLKRYVETGRP